MSPVLLLVLAGLWAAVLIPATRTSRDIVHDGRSMQGFSTAMRVLSRRAQPTYGRYIMVPTADMTEVAPGGSPRQLVRRRRMLARLVAVALITLLAAVVLGGFWLPVHLAVDGLMVAYVVRLRRLALRRAEATRAARRAALHRHEEDLRAEYDARYHAEPPPTAPAYDEPERRAVNG
jgi:hypothetical protein